MHSTARLRRVILLFVPEAMAAIPVSVWTSPRPTRDRVPGCPAARLPGCPAAGGAALLLVVGDDGVGGADLAGGTGPAGLAGRVASVDGTLSVDSPVGGPTVMTVELPCVP